MLISEEIIKKKIPKLWTPKAENIFKNDDKVSNKKVKIEHKKDLNKKSLLFCSRKAINGKELKIDIDSVAIIMLIKIWFWIEAPINSEKITKSSVEIDVKINGWLL